MVGNEVNLREAFPDHLDRTIDRGVVHHVYLQVNGGFVGVAMLSLYFQVGGKNRLQALLEEVFDVIVDYDYTEPHSFLFLRLRAFFSWAVSIMAIASSSVSFSGSTVLGMR